MKKVKDAEIVEENDNEEKLFIRRESPKREPKQKKDNRVIITAVVTALVCCGLFALFYIYVLPHMLVETIKYDKSVTITDSGIADAVEKVYDSVIVVETFSKGNIYATGTGFVFKTDDKYGYIITNNHVISSGDSVKVVFTNNDEVDAKVVGSDTYSDIAVLSVPKDKVLLVASLGESEKMRVGDTTFAVGAPVDSSVYSWSVTRGILSGKNRLIEVQESSRNSNTWIMEVLQTDTAINSGNSGGPLCNSNGEVIGVTNMKLASSSIEGMGFAIPVEEAKYYAETLISGGTISRPYLGVVVSDGKYTNNNNDRNSFYRFFYGDYDIPTTENEKGVFVQEVEKDGVADKAGIKAGDKITKVNGTEVEDTTHFKYELYKYKIGDTITITIERDKTAVDVTVTLASNQKAS